MTRSISILAVGTEVVEGQIIDRNSAWIASACARMGFAIASHRTVPDDRVAIRAAIDELARESSILFVTGGLGPTSDDFTRELIADAFGAPLEFSESAWTELQEKLAARGVPTREAQKKQCWFPRGARILPNAAGTACGFRMARAADGLRLFAMPGPPSEVAAVFEATVRAELEGEVPAEERFDLRIWRCLGKGESDLAELAERALEGGGMTVGYRAHLPYVEVKVWVPRARAAEKRPWLDALEAALAAWIVNRDGEDAAASFVGACRAGTRVLDAATGGIFVERARPFATAGKALDVQTKFDLSSGGALGAAAADFDGAISIAEPNRLWRLAWRAGGEIATRDVAPPFRYDFASERARKFICETALLAFARAASGQGL